MKRKTILICAEYISEWKDTTKHKTEIFDNTIRERTLMIDYSNVTVFGETKDSDGIHCIIAGHLFQNTCHEKLIKYCTEWFCKFYNVDDSNITYMEYLVNLN